MSALRKGSKKYELVKKSREAALAAVQIFNNPNITFKSESFSVLMIISWTYLLHAYFENQGIEYRYFQQKNKRKKFDKTKHGAFKHWELERCLDCKDCPIEHSAKLNLKFIIGLRHEIEHQMTSRIDDSLSARFQACCLNYNQYVKDFFGDEWGIENHLSFSLQFSTISEPQKELLSEHSELPTNIQSYIHDFDNQLTDEEYNDEKYAYRILYVPKTANRKGQADKVIEFVKADDPIASTVNKEYAVLKETEKKKYLPKQIVELMQSEGFSKFKMHQHTIFWKEKDARKANKGFGVQVAKQWYWYENWVIEVRNHCKKNKQKYQ